MKYARLITFTAGFCLGGGLFAYSVSGGHDLLGSTMYIIGALTIVPVLLTKIVSLACDAGDAPVYRVGDGVGCHGGSGEVPFGIGLGIVFGLLFLLIQYLYKKYWKLL
jgi:hypothetical protein